MTLVQVVKDQHHTHSSNLFYIALRPPRWQITGVVAQAISLGQDHCQPLQWVALGVVALIASVMREKNPWVLAPGADLQLTHRLMAMLDLARSHLSDP